MSGRSPLTPGSWLLASGFSVLLGGCLDTHSGRPSPPGEKPVFVSAHEIPGVNAPIPDSWERIFVGELPRPALAGYVRTHQDPGQESQLILHWVYDANFRLAGVMTDDGKTTRFDLHGQPHQLGALTTDLALLSIFEYETVQRVHHTLMPPPKE